MKAAVDSDSLGGVLSDGAIKREVDAGRLIVDRFKLKSLKPASYDVTVASDGLIDPSERALEPGGGQALDRVSLEPGDAAMFSTDETFCMPDAVAGNITIKNRLATKGLLLLSGGLIDPGYGHEEAGGERGCRLYLHVANIGKGTIEIRPGVDRIARIQFLRVCGVDLNSREPIKASRWHDQTKPSLGFLSDLKQLKDSSERNRDLISFVVVGGVFVLFMTMISVSLAVILSLSSDHRLELAAKAAAPQSTSGKWLWGALVLGLSVIALCSTAALLLRIKRDRLQSRR